MRERLDGGDGAAPSSAACATSPPCGTASAGRPRLTRAKGAHRARRAARGPRARVVLAGARARRPRRDRRHRRRRGRPVLGPPAARRQARGHDDPRRPRRRWRRASSSSAGPRSRATPTCVSPHGRGVVALRPSSARRLRRCAARAPRAGGPLRSRRARASPCASAAAGGRAGALAPRPAGEPMCSRRGRRAGRCARAAARGRAPARLLLTQPRDAARCVRLSQHLHVVRIPNVDFVGLWVTKSTLAKRPPRRAAKVL